MLERAVDLDPQFALAQSYLAFVRVAVDGYAAAPRATLDSAFAMAAQAVDRDPQESRCHRMLAQICVNRRKLSTAQRHLERALQLNPNDADGMQQMGYVLALRGRPEDALTWMAKARRLNPFHPTRHNSGLGVALYSLGRYPEAAESSVRQVSGMLILNPRCSRTEANPDVRRSSWLQTHAQAMLLFLKTRGRTWTANSTMPWEKPSRRVILSR
jgi:Tfp pilus assembly protein PilF